MSTFSLCVYTLIVSQDGGLEARLREAFLMPMIALLGCWWGHNSLSVPAGRSPLISSSPENLMKSAPHSVTFIVF
jgi:hypothetical protein